MGDLLALVALLATVGAVVGGLPWLASRVRRRGTGGSVLGPFEEIWHPAAYRARIEVHQQQERPAPAPSPGDPPPSDGSSP